MRFPIHVLIVLVISNRPRASCSSDFDTTRATTPSIVLHWVQLVLLIQWIKLKHVRELKQTTLAAATKRSLSKTVNNEQNNGCAGAIEVFVHFEAVLCTTTQKCSSSRRLVILFVIIAKQLLLFLWFVLSFSQRVSSHSCETLRELLHRNNNVKWPSSASFGWRRPPI